VFGDLGEPEVVATEQILCDGHAPGEQVFHRRQAHVRVRRSKNAERESAAFLASWATVHERAGSPCIWRRGISPAWSKNNFRPRIHGLMRTMVLDRGPVATLDHALDLPTKHAGAAVATDPGKRVDALNNYSSTPFPLGGTAVSLYKEEGGQRRMVQSAYTATNGMYYFSDVAPGR
jgi:hypothetical protein